jgi:hypothetical protein
MRRDSKKQKKEQQHHKTRRLPFQSTCRSHKHTAQSGATTYSGISTYTTVFFHPVESCRTQSFLSWKHICKFHCMSLEVMEKNCSVSFLCIFHNYEYVKVEKVERVVDKADWNNDNRHALIMAVLDLIQNREGGEDSNGFKKREWLSILTSFNSSTGLKYNRQQLQSQLSILKAAYTSCSRVLIDNGVCEMQCFCWETLWFVKCSVFVGKLCGSYTEFRKTVFSPNAH